MIPSPFFLPVREERIALQERARRMTELALAKKVMG